MEGARRFSFYQEWTVQSFLTRARADNTARARGHLPRMLIIISLNTPFLTGVTGRPSTPGLSAAVAGITITTSTTPPTSTSLQPPVGSVAEEPNGLPFASHPGVGLLTTTPTPSTITLTSHLPAGTVAEEPNGLPFGSHLGGGIPTTTITTTTTTTTSITTPIFAFGAGSSAERPSGPPTAAGLWQAFLTNFQHTHPLNNDGQVPGPSRLPDAGPDSARSSEARKLRLKEKRARHRANKRAKSKAAREEHRQQDTKPPTTPPTPTHTTPSSTPPSTPTRTTTDGPPRAINQTARPSARGGPPTNNPRIFTPIPPTQTTTPTPGTVIIDRPVLEVRAALLTAGPEVAALEPMIIVPQGESRSRVSVEGPAVGLLPAVLGRAGLEPLAPGTPRTRVRALVPAGLHPILTNEALVTHAAIQLRVNPTELTFISQRINPTGGNGGTARRTVWLDVSGAALDAINDRQGVIPIVGQRVQFFAQPSPAPPHPGSS